MTSFTACINRKLVGAIDRCEKVTMENIVSIAYVQFNVIEDYDLSLWSCYRGSQYGIEGNIYNGMKSNVIL